MTQTESHPFLLVRRRVVEEAPPSSKPPKKALRDAPPPSDRAGAVDAHAPARRARVVTVGSTVILGDPTGKSSRTGATEVLLRASVLPQKPKRSIIPMILFAGLTLMAFAAYVVTRLH
jgi:hypothetical protein